jgi:membrane protein implicated in regulation of membrane protease activity
MLGAFLAMWISVSYLLSGHNRWWPVGLALASVSCSLVSYWRLRPMLRRLLGPESSDQRQ